eukprot:jgi/Psemu1/302972/fgenesh1_kg.87_\
MIPRDYDYNTRNTTIMRFDFLSFQYSYSYCTVLPNCPNKRGQWWLELSFQF